MFDLRSKILGYAQTVVCLMQSHWFGVCFCTNLYKYKHKCSKSLRILDYGLWGNAITPLY